MCLLKILKEILQFPNPVPKGKLDLLSGLLTMLNDVECMDRGRASANGNTWERYQQLANVGKINTRLCRILRDFCTLVSSSQPTPPQKKYLLCRRGKTGVREVADGEMSFHPRFPIFGKCHANDTTFAADW